jgi:hypothetical protein
MRLLLIAAALAAGSAVAAYSNDTMVARRGGDAVRLWDAPCTYEDVTKRIKPEHRDKFRRAQATISKQEFLACWVVDGDAVFLMYEDGDQSLIPVSEFKPDQGA